jgi:8-oxo-dGTP diphosphatase
MSALTQMSLLFLTTESQVLLGKKKTSFGKGHYVGIGGRQEANETIEQTVVRECQEEIGITPLQFKKVGRLEFLFPHKLNWNQEVHVYTSTSWQGEPTDSDEITPQWFDKNKLPLNEMWSDAPHWLPSILNGEKLNATFSFTKDLGLESYQIHKGGEIAFQRLSTSAFQVFLTG